MLGLTHTLALFALAAPLQGVDPHQVFRFDGVEVGDALGVAAIGLPDLDGDGRSEFAIGAPRPLSDGAGRVLVIDGATGALRQQLIGTPPVRGGSARFGAALAALPDLDGDGVPELAIGAPREHVNGVASGTVEIRSLADGSLLARLVGQPAERVGQSLLAADVDGDGLDDLVVGGPGGDRVTSWSAAALTTMIAGGPNASPFWALDGSGGFGHALAAAGDLDGDGGVELAIGAPSDDGPGLPFAGSVRVVSGTSGATLALLVGGTAGEAFGTALAGPGDLDGDGLAELGVGAPGRDARRGAIDVVRGAWLLAAAGPELHWSASGDAPDDLLGATLARTDDANADGLGELATSASRLSALQGAGRVLVLSGADGALLSESPELGPEDLTGAGLVALDLTTEAGTELLVGSPFTGVAERGTLRALTLDPRRLAADAHRIDVELGGDVTLTLGLGPERANHFYVILGSASGTAPGIPSPVGTLPLVFDVYTQLALGNPPELSGFSGFLDASGEALASVTMDAALALQYLPFQLHFAAVTVDPFAPGLPFSAVTNAVPLGFDTGGCTTFDPALDCDGNGLEDACEILLGTAADCDGNGVPDVCQLGSPGADVDHDGVLDACRERVYVDLAATGAGDGSSWADAHTDLALAIAQAPDLAELWVASGTYRPGAAGTEAVATFSLERGIVLLGGFAGGEVSALQRDWIANPTVLSGDLAGDDDQPGGSLDDNAWSVVTAPGVGALTARLEGFTIRAGFADEPVGCQAGAPDAAGCRGGGLFCVGSPILRDCVFVGNVGGEFGGGAFVSGSPSFVRCRFEGNSAVRGGAVYVDGGAAPRFTACELIGNSGLEGGGLRIAGAVGDRVEFVGGTLIGNTALESGGAAHVEGAELVLVQSTLAGNDAGLATGGVFGAAGATASVTGSILWGNTATQGTLFEQQLGLAHGLHHACVEGLAPGAPGSGNLAADPLFLSLPGPDGQFGTSDDDPGLDATSPCVDASDGSALVADTDDLDGDGDLAEALPLDVLGAPRAVDDPAVADLGPPAPSGAAVDIGAVERQP